MRAWARVRAVLGLGFDITPALTPQAKAFLSHPLCRQLTDTIMHSNDRPVVMDTYT